MMMLPTGVRVHLAVGVTDMRKGLDGLNMLVQSVLAEDPFSGHLFAFRGRKANMIKILFWDGNGLCLFTKRLDQGGFVWPRADDPGGKVVLSSAQLSLLILRPQPALPAVADLRASRYRPGAIHACRMGGRCMLVARRAP